MALPRGAMHAFRRTEDTTSKFSEQPSIFYVQLDIKHNVFYLGAILN
jgi:hypothetical protein